MNVRSYAVRISLALAFCGANSAWGETLVYSQPAVSPVQRLLIAELISSSTGPNELFIPADDFTLTEAASITSVQWQGAYFDGRPPGSPSPAATRFLVEFFDTINGQPGNLLVPPNNLTVTPAEAHETFVDFLPGFSDPDDLLFSGGNGLFIYNYRVDFSTPVHLEAGQQYWLGLSAFLPIDSTGFDWLVPVGTGGNGASVSLSGSGDPFPLHFDTNFALYSADTASTPEPAPLTTVGLAIVFLFVVSGRRSRRATLRGRFMTPD